MDQSLSHKRCQQMQPKWGLNVAITRNTLTQNLAIKGEKCDDTHQYCSNTNGCFCPRKQVASKQPTCVESEREVNKVNERLTEAVKGRHAAIRTTRPHHTPPFYPPETRIAHTEATRSAQNTSGGLRRVGLAAQSASSASTRSINRRSATSIRLATPSSSKSPMSFVTSVTMSRASRRASRADRSAVKRRTSARAY